MYFIRYSKKWSENVSFESDIYAKVNTELVMNTGCTPKYTNEYTTQGANNKSIQISRHNKYAYYDVLTALF